MEKTKIILCDDHAIFRQGIRATLATEDSVEILAEAENGLECIDLVERFSPDVLFLDINMPDMDGLECVQEVKKRFPDVKVITLTQYDEKRFVKQMMKFGADGYILKSTSRKEMLTAIQRVMSGKQYLAEEADRHLQGLQTEDEPNRLFPQLSDREKEIIKLLCNEKSTKQIAEEIFLSANTIESHRANIFKKVGVSNVAGLVRWAVHNGLDR
jgi:DNA-binding NarL/FixJ family response regulator